MPHPSVVVLSLPGLTLAVIENVHEGQWMYRGKRVACHFCHRAPKTGGMVLTSWVIPEDFLELPHITKALDAQGVTPRTPPVAG